VIDPGKLYDWLEKENIEILRWDDDGSNWVSREEFEKLFRAYVKELTNR